MIFQKNLNFKLILLCFFGSATLYGQTNTMAAFTSASYSYNPTNNNENQYEWRLDLGMTSIELNQSSRYFFTVGVLQPNLNRLNTNEAKKNFDPHIKLAYLANSSSIVLFSLAPDALIFGFKIINSNGKLIKTVTTRIASSYLNFRIDLSNQPNGLYFITVYYLPEHIALNDAKNYCTKTLKILKW